VLVGIYEERKRGRGAVGRKNIPLLKKGGEEKYARPSSRLRQRERAVMEGHRGKSGSVQTSS